MKNMIMILLVALTAFGAAAGGSWKWQQIKLAEKSAETHDEEAAAPSRQSSHEGSAGTPSQKSAPTVKAKDQPLPDRPPVAAHEPPTRAIPQPTYTPGVDETVQLASSLRDRAAIVRERENQLVARQKQLELVVEDIRSERATIDELRKQLDELLKTGSEQMADVQRQRTELDIKQQNINGQVTEMVGQEKDNIKKMGSVYDNMAPDSAAKILQQMADSGTMDTAVKLLAVMKERQAAKVLAEMPDPTLAAQLSERLKDLKKPAPTTKK